MVGLLQLRRRETSTPTYSFDTGEQSDDGIGASLVDHEGSVNDNSADETCSSSGEGSSAEDEEDEGCSGEGTEEVAQAPNVVWNLDCTFAQKEQLDEFFKREYWWSCRSTSATTQGIKVLYRCNRVARKSKVQCAAGLYVITTIVYEKDGRAEMSSLYFVYRENTVHTHDTNTQMVGKVSGNV